MSKLQILVGAVVLVVVVIVSWVVEGMAHLHPESLLWAVPAALLAISWSPSKPNRD